MEFISFFPRKKEEERNTILLVLPIEEISLQPDRALQSSAFFRGGTLRFTDRQTEILVSNIQGGFFSGPSPLISLSPRPIINFWT